MIPNWAGKQNLCLVSHSQYLFIFSVNHLNLRLWLHFSSFQQLLLLLTLYQMRQLVKQGHSLLSYESIRLIKWITTCKRFGKEYGKVVKIAVISNPALSERDVCVLPVFLNFIMNTFSGEVKNSGLEHLSSWLTLNTCILYSNELGEIFKKSRRANWVLFMIKPTKMTSIATPISICSLKILVWIWGV